MCKENSLEAGHQNKLEDIVNGAFCDIRWGGYSTWLQKSTFEIEREMQRRPSLVAGVVGQWLVFICDAYFIISLFEFVFCLCSSSSIRSSSALGCMAWFQRTSYWFHLKERHCRKVVEHTSGTEHYSKECGVVVRISNTNNNYYYYYSIAVDFSARSARRCQGGGGGCQWTNQRENRIPTPGKRAKCLGILGGTGGRCGEHELLPSVQT